jgi:hypothetical protein
MAFVSYGFVSVRVRVLLNLLHAATALETSDRAPEPYLIILVAERLNENSLSWRHTTLALA